MLIHSRFLLLAFATFAIFTLGACSSIYHRTGSDLSVGLGPLLSTRITEARNDAVAAADAISKPSSHNADIAEPLSWDFSKSVASVHDVVKRLEIQDDPVNDVLAAFDRADADLAAAVDAQASPTAHPATFAAAADSLSLAIAKADAYLKTGPTSTRPVAAAR